MKSQYFLSSHCMTVVKVPIDQNAWQEVVDARSHWSVISGKIDPAQGLRELGVKEELIVWMIRTSIKEREVPINALQGYGRESLADDEEGWRWGNGDLGPEFRKVGQKPNLEHLEMTSADGRFRGRNKVFNRLIKERKDEEPDCECFTLRDGLS